MCLNFKRHTFMCHTIIIIIIRESKGATSLTTTFEKKTWHFLRTISNYRKGDEVIRLWHSLLYHKINHQLMNQKIQRARQCVAVSRLMHVFELKEKTHSKILHKEDKHNRA